MTEKKINLELLMTDLAWDHWPEEGEDPWPAGRGFGEEVREHALAATENAQVGSIIEDDLNDRPSAARDELRAAFRIGVEAGLGGARDQGGSTATKPSRPRTSSRTALGLLALGAIVVVAAVLLRGPPDAEPPGQGVRAQIADVWREAEENRRVNEAIASFERRRAVVESFADDTFQLETKFKAACRDAQATIDDECALAAARADVGDPRYGAFADALVKYHQRYPDLAEAVAQRCRANSMPEILGGRPTIELEFENWATAFQFHRLAAFRLNPKGPTRDIIQEFARTLKDGCGDRS